MERLWSGALAPEAKVSESRLARELGMSRTPVREAIGRLEREGALQQVASSGTFVRRPERLAIAEAYDERLAGGGGGCPGEPSPNDRRTIAAIMTRFQP